ncbi:MAG TPA: methylaspartate mutase subunit S [Planctomycetota bacterium]|nr:methylaspartate mutase subunit S [Planctomycetota bacterium]
MPPNASQGSTSGPTMILGVIGADCHAVGNRILELAFREAGLNVVNLGVMVSQEEFIAAAIETRAAAIVVSSLYGHGEMDCRGFREKCVEAGLGGILLYVGGNLVVGKADFAGVEAKFRAMGFDRVFGPGSGPEHGIAALKDDLRARGVAFG